MRRNPIRYSLLGGKNPRSEGEKGIETPDKFVGIPEKNGAFGILGFSPKDSMFWLASTEKKISLKHNGLKQQ